MDCIISSDTVSRQSKIHKDTYFRIMRHLQENPEMSQRDLADKLGMSSEWVELLLKGPNRQRVCQAW